MEEVLTNDSFSNLTYTKLKRFNKDYWKFVLIMFPTIPISAILPYLGNIYLKNNKDNIFVHGTIFPDNWTIIAGLIFALLFFISLCFHRYSHLKMTCKLKLTS